MKTNAKKLLLATAVSAALVSGALINQAKATELEIDAVAVTRAAIELTSVTSMDFGTIDYLSTNAGTVVIGTDGNIDDATAVDVTFSGPTTAAQVGVVSDGTTDMDVACDLTGTLGDGTNTIDLVAVEVAVDTPVAAGAGTPCSDGVASVTTIPAAATATVYLGGTLDLANTPITNDGNFTTSAANGVQVTLAVTYQ